MYLPRAGRFDLNPTNISHHHLAFELQGSPRFRPDIGGWDDLRSELEANRPDTVFLTCELFEHIITEEKGAQALLDQLTSITDDITLVLVARDWPSFVNSMYNQAIKMFAISYGFDRYVELNIEAGLTRLRDLYRPLLDDPRTKFVCVTYQDIREPDPLTALLRAAGLDRAVTRFTLPDGLVNTSLGAIGVEVTAILGKYLSADTDDWSWEHPAAQELHIRNLVTTDRRGWNAEPFWGWTPSSSPASTTGSAATWTTSPKPSGATTGRATSAPTSRSSSPTSSTTRPTCWRTRSTTSPGCGASTASCGRPEPWTWS